MTKLAEPQEKALMLDKNYRDFLVDIKTRMHKAQVRAALAVNVEKVHQWGDKFLTQLSHDMREAFPGMQGFSVTNLKRMRLFAQVYPFVAVAKCLNFINTAETLTNHCMIINYLNHVVKISFNKYCYLGNDTCASRSRYLMKI